MPAKVSNKRRKQREQKKLYECGIAGAVREKRTVRHGRLKAADVGKVGFVQAAAQSTTIPTGPRQWIRRATAII